MKTSLFLLVSLPVALFGAQNRVGPNASAPADNPPAARACPMAGDCALTAVNVNSPSTLPAADLIAAIEEERVAHDLYVEAARRWGLPVFQQIAVAETRHEAALTQLATASGLAVPAATPGTYATPALQRIYAQLLELVNGSENGALKAGALVEETDIADLRDMMKQVQDEPTRTVLAQLERASMQHLSAFVRNLASRGVTYEPQVLSAEEFAAALARAGGPGRGRGYRGGR